MRRQRLVLALAAVVAVVAIGVGRHAPTPAAPTMLSFRVGQSFE
jgi:hypothetical protein